MGNYKVFISIWFTISLFTEILNSIMLWFWLRLHGVRLGFGLTGTSGYMENAYLYWSKSQGKSGKRLVIFKAVLIINIIISAYCFYLIMAKS